MDYTTRKAMKTYGEVESLYESIVPLSEYPNREIALLVFRVKACLIPHVESLKKLVVKSPEYLAYCREKYAIASSFAEKDRKGQAVVEKVERFGVTLRIPESSKKGYTTKVAELDAKYAEVLKTRTAQEAEYWKWTKQELEIELPVIPISDLPKDITESTISILAPLIEGI